MPPSLQVVQHCFTRLLFQLPADIRDRRENLKSSGYLLFSVHIMYIITLVTAVVFCHFFFCTTGGLDECYTLKCSTRFQL